MSRSFAAVEGFLERILERPAARLFHAHPQPVQLERRIERETLGRPKYMNMRIACPSGQLDAWRGWIRIEGLYRLGYHACVCLLPVCRKEDCALYVSTFILGIDLPVRIGMPQIAAMA